METEKKSSQKGLYLSTMHDLASKGKVFNKPILTF